MKFHQNWSKNHQHLEEFHQNFDDFECFLGALGGPESWEMQKRHTITGRKQLWDSFFGTPKALQKR